MDFDEVFYNIWLRNEVERVEGRDLLRVARQKGFNSIVEWRLATALRFGMDKMQWRLEIISDPNTVLPQVVIGPYQGWSQFFDNQLNTTFEQALKIPEFLAWCKAHDRIIPLSQNFPLPTSIILFRKPNGQLIHVEGGHRICAVAYKKHVGEPLDFSDKSAITAAVADITEADVENLKEFLKQGTFKK